jgi:hypothetical protein
MLLLYSTTLCYAPTLLYPTLHYSTVPSTLPYATLEYCLRYLTLSYTTLRYSTLLYSTLRYSTLPTMLCYLTLRYPTLLYTTLCYTPTLLHYPTLTCADLRWPYWCVALFLAAVHHCLIWSPLLKITTFAPRIAPQPLCQFLSYFAHPIYSIIPSF